MKLSEIINYINTALDYPALTYKDVDLFLDAAIAELNTTLHTSIPLVKDMVKEFKQLWLDYAPNKIRLTVDPANSDFNIPTISGGAYFYSIPDKQFWVKNFSTGEYVGPFHKLQAIYIDAEKLHIYNTMVFGDSAAWVEVPTDPTFEADLEEYLPDEWIILWLIPYVCYKYSVRDGGTAQSYAEELTQGFQQLQESYDVPSTVLLTKYADRPAYKSLVEKHLPNLNILVPTRAIYGEMKHSREVQAIFGGFYDRGGF